MSFDIMLYLAKEAIENEDWEAFGDMERKAARYLLSLDDIPYSWRRQFFEVFKEEHKRWTA